MGVLEGVQVGLVGLGPLNWVGEKVDNIFFATSMYGIGHQIKRKQLSWFKTHVWWFWWT